MPVRIRLSRGGAKKRPFYRIVVADSRRARDGKFIDQIGTYNPMLPKDSADRVKMDVDKAKEWISKGAKPSDRISIFLSNLGVMDKPVITEKTKKHLPKKKTQERLAAAKEKEEAAKVAAEEPKAEEAKPAEEPKAASAFTIPNNLGVSCLVPKDNKYFLWSYNVGKIGYENISYNK